MQKLKKILVPTDFSECAFKAMRYALLFSDKYNGKYSIELLNVVYPEAEPVDFPVFSDSATRQRVEWSNENLKSFSETAIAQVQAAYTLKRVPEIKACVEIGTTPSSVIARVAKQDETDLIIMGTHGENDTLEKIIGTTASATIRKSSKPTIIIPKDYHLENIVTLGFATDLSTTDPYHIWELRKFLEPFSLIMRVVHIDNHLEKNSKAIQMKNLEDFFKEQLPSLQITFHDIPGTDVVKSLNNFSDEWNVNLMVFYRKHRSFFNQLFHQSVTTQTALKSRIPTLIIPD